jgi:signal transduction histidine kinase
VGRMVRVLLRWEIAGDFKALRLVVLPLVPGFLLLHTPGRQPSSVDWALGLSAALLSLASGRIPLTVTMGQSTLVAIASAFADASPVIVKVMASVALLELAVRCWGVPTICGAASLTGAYVVAIADTPASALASLGYKVALVVGAPVLLGAYVRSLQDVAQLARQRAAEERIRHEAGVREAQLAERTAIARELHDIVAHHMAAMVLHVGVARHVMPRLEPAVDQVLDDVHRGASTTLTDLRRLVAVLRDPDKAPAHPETRLVDPAELPTELDALMERARTAGVPLTASVDPAVAGLDAVRALTVVRLVQEGLTNVVKHGDPQRRAGVRVGFAGSGEVQVEVRNEGTFPLPNGSPDSYGLAGLRERVALTDGRLHAGPTRDGWRLAATLPATATPSGPAENAASPTSRGSEQQP